VMTVPQFDPGSPQMISQGPSVCIFNKADPQEVLASWLFVQYLLTNDVQIAYSETEGYVPVTSKARSSAEYQNYLSRSGEDNAAYYDVKIQAAQLLLDNTDHTFVTPVFNGSASLRSAAGQLVENTVKSVRRNETVDEAYVEQLYADVISLYRLDQPGASGAASGKEDLGPLPATAAALLASLAAAWVLIVVYFVVQMAQKRKRIAE
ncbi:MAG: ABC transporter substrate-binding protein, partial [Oscillospiraceae bacterium]|nr:ABC transporter substrate-binding protein [Oscillospiraceae bacterium]